MGPRDFADALDRELGSITRGLAEASAADDGLSAPVPACPGWTIRDLAHHLGRLHRWVAHAIDHGNPDLPTPDWPADADLTLWFAAGAAELSAHLEADPDTPAWAFGPEKRVGFWQRRQAHEHAIHSWDLGDALGRHRPIETELARDGIAEVAELFYPRQLRLGRLTEPDQSLAVTTDAGQTWQFGSGPLVATLTGGPSDLLLALWHRLPADHPTLTWTGDPAAGQGLLALPLTP